MNGMGAGGEKREIIVDVSCCLIGKQWWRKKKEQLHVFLMLVGAHHDRGRTFNCTCYVFEYGCVDCRQNEWIFKKCLMVTTDTFASSFLHIRNFALMPWQLACEQIKTEWESGSRGKINKRISTRVSMVRVAKRPKNIQVRIPACICWFYFFFAFWLRCATLRCSHLFCTGLTLFVHNLISVLDCAEIIWRMARRQILRCR